MERKAVAVIFNRDSMDEFIMLAKEAGYSICGIVYLRRFTSYGISQDKINEIRKVMDHCEAENIVFDTQLKPRHLFNIAKELGVEPKDRVEIILEIFRNHSPSKEADLQIKLASLQYELARARERVHLRRMGEQPGITSGLGEYEVDIYYKEIKRVIQNIKRKLAEERKRRDIHRLSREKRGFKTISITGYYSSGKTTLFNAITGASCLTGPEPFTTLSTKFSTIWIGPWKCYLVDTIGFISDLPPFMIMAFYSTLEEIKFSDLVLLVIDVSEDYDIIKRKVLASLDILKRLEYEGKIIAVGNKIDLVNNRESLNSIHTLLIQHVGDVVFVSSKYGRGISELLKKIKGALGEIVRINIELPYGDCVYSVIDFLKKYSNDVEPVYNGDSVRITCSIDKDIYPNIKRYVVERGGKILGDIDIKAVS